MKTNFNFHLPLMCYIVTINLFFLIHSFAQTQKDIKLKDTLPLIPAGYTVKPGIIFISKEDTLPILHPIEDGAEFAMADGDYQKAILYYDTLIYFNPGISYYYYMRGVCKDSIKNYQEAVYDFTKALQLSPQNKNERMMPDGILAIKPGIGAISDWRDQKYYYIFVERGNAKANLSDFRGAIQDFSEALNWQKNAYSIYFGRGECKYSIGDNAGAILDLNNCLSLKNDYADAYYVRGLCNFELKQKNAGCLDLSKAGELGKKEVYSIIQKYCQ